MFSSDSTGHNRVVTLEVLRQDVGVQDRFDRHLRASASSCLAVVFPGTQWKPRRRVALSFGTCQTIPDAAACFAQGRIYA